MLRTPGTSLDPKALSACAEFAGKIATMKPRIGRPVRHGGWLNLCLSPSLLRAPRRSDWRKPYAGRCVARARFLRLNGFVLESDVLAVNLTLRGICNEIRIA